MRTIFRLSKMYASTTKESVYILVTADKKLIAFHANAENISNVEGLNENVGTYISNNLRVFTPTAISLYDESIRINFTSENISFKAKLCSERQVENLFGELYYDFIYEGHEFITLEKLEAQQ